MIYKALVGIGFLAKAFLLVWGKMSDILKMPDI